MYQAIKEIIDATAERIKNIVREPEKDKIYNAKVVKILSDKGCFVEIWPGCEGMVHISQLAPERVEKVEDVVKEGDEILVKVTDIDNQGRINLSRKDALEEQEQNKEDK